MSRLQVLVHRPRRTLAALATVLVAVGITAASGADFTASSANPTNTFATGTLAISNSNPAAAIMTVSGLKPGDAPVPGFVDIGNSGTLSGAFTLTRGTPSDSDATYPLSTKLNLTVIDCGVFVGSTPPTCAGGTTKYTGTLAQMGTAGHLISALGTFAGGVKHRYEFDVSVDSSAGNGFQATSSSVDFTWAAA